MTPLLVVLCATLQAPNLGVERAPPPAETPQRVQVELRVPPLAPPHRPPRKRSRFAQRRLVFRPQGVNTPLLLSFAPRGHAELVSSAAAFAFEPGAAALSAWPRPTTPWLVRDLNHDGRIDSGRELLGSFTMVDGRLAPDGFAALAALDDNHDGVVDARDPAFASLALWRDDGDKLVQPGELVPLPEAGVTSLSTRAQKVRVCDAQGNCEVLRGDFTFRDAQGVQRLGTLLDVTLTLSPQARW